MNYLPIILCFPDDVLVVKLHWSKKDSKSLRREWLDLSFFEW